MNSGLSNREDVKFNSKLKSALNAGDVTMVKRLLKGGVSLASRAWYDVTVLHDMVFRGKYEMVKLLLEYGADVHSTSADGRTCLHNACRQGNMSMVSLLLSAEADPNIQTDDGRTCLHIATWKRNTALVQILLDKDCHPNKQDEDGWTALHWAAKHGDSKRIDLLIQHGARINMPDKNGRTPLHETFQATQVDEKSVELLLYFGADPNIPSKVEDKLGTTLSFACRNKTCTTHVLDILLTCGYLVHRDRYFKSPAINGDLKRHKLLTDYDVVQFKEPPKLTHLCRVKARTLVGKHHHGKELIASLTKLPLPRTVIDYLKYNEIKWKHIKVS